MNRFRKISVLCTCTCACALVLAATNAGAQQATTTGAATVLFDEAVALMEKGKFALACPKLARSNELSPNGGTLFALAECYEKNGQVASAWVTYKEAAIRASAAQRADAEKKATEAAERLAPKVSRLSVQVPPESVLQGLAIALDGRPVARAEWGIATPIDPGTHKVTASAPGRLPITREIAFDAVAGQKVVTIPVLEAEPPSAVPEQEGASRGRTQRILGLVVGGVGLGGIAVGTIFGLSASSKNDDAASHCRDGNLCDAEGIRLDKEGRDAATISTIAFIAGGTLAATGIVLFLTAPSGAEKPASTVGMMGVRGTPGGAALTLGASF
jgi:hypothetical protein